MTVHTNGKRPGHPRGLRAGGKPQRLLDFFAQNPDEELTLSDVATKLGACHRSARVLVNRLCRAGDLQVIKIVRKKP